MWVVKERKESNLPDGDREDYRGAHFRGRAQVHLGEVKPEMSARLSSRDMG